MSTGSLGLLPRAGLGPRNAPAGDLKGGKKGRELIYLLSTPVVCRGFTAG